MVGLADTKYSRCLQSPLTSLSPPSNTRSDASVDQTMKELMQCFGFDFDFDAMKEIEPNVKKLQFEANVLGLSCGLVLILSELQFYRFIPIVFCHSFVSGDVWH
jgi:hypothetical protein